MTFARLLAVILTIVATLFVSSFVAAADKPVNFTRDIKPILSNNCFACHGPDVKHREADLRLDVRDNAVDVAFVPGQADRSLLIKRISSTDPDERMPPEQSNKPPLSAEQIELFRRWIDEGARYDAHWAYVVPQRPEPPRVSDASQPVNPVDSFVEAERDQHGLRAATEADRRTLIRRLSFDLVGLPPTPAEVDAFVADDSPEAYERLVDRLLASEHFGERMALYWLDMVRYADTNGIHGDNHQDHDLYRDYVIAAFNANKPFDQFTIEQLAGDLISNATDEQRIASGYNRLNMTTREGGAQAKEYLAKYAADRVRNVSEVWLGSTLGCAECHDHKFDPFRTQDFYSMGAFFADIQETAVGVQQPVNMATDDQKQQLAQLDEQLAALRKLMVTPTPELAAAQTKWESQARSELSTQQSAWNLLTPAAAVSEGGATLTVQDDQSVLSSGANPAKDTYVVTLMTDLPRVTGLRLEALMHPSLTNGSLSRANGNFVLTRFEVEAVPAGKSESLTVKVAAAEADFSQDGFPVANAIDGNANTGWAAAGHQKKQHRTAVFTFAEPIPGGTGTTITVRLRHESQYAQHNIGCFRLAVTSVDKPSLSEQGSVPVEIAAALKLDADGRSPEQNEMLATYYRGIAPELAATRQQIADFEKQKTAITESFRPILIASPGPPREMRVLPRGNWLDDSGEVVQPAVPAFLKPLDVKERRATRMDLARWLVDPENPIVSRVFVNRLWKVAFGRGIVTTLDDYGSQGTPPTHPELLDWLATEFIASGWDVKHVLKLVVMSRTYRQSSFESPDLRRLDPANRWLARQNRFRLDAETVRDNALAISGLLSEKVGGPSVKPYQPGGYWDHLNFPQRVYENDRGESQYRRGLYTYWCRTFLHPSLLAFDAPSRERCTVERPRSNTPLQALVLLNDPTYVEAARVFAARIIHEGGESIDEQLKFAFREALGREPQPTETRVLGGLYEKHWKQYSADAGGAVELLKVGQSPLPSDIDHAQLAAWTSVARVILNLHETITRN